MGYWADETGNSTAQTRINYPIVGLGTNPMNLPIGTLVAIPGEPGGSPIGLTLVFTLAAQEFWYGVIGGTGAAFIRAHA